MGGWGFVPGERGRWIPCSWGYPSFYLRSVAKKGKKRNKIFRLLRSRYSLLAAAFLSKKDFVLKPPFNSKLRRKNCWLAIFYINWSYMGEACARDFSSSQVCVAKAFNLKGPFIQKLRKKVKFSAREFS